MNGNGDTERVARAIYDAFDAYHAEFRAITRRGKGRFERRDWHGILDDARERLACYTAHLQPALQRVRTILGADATDVPIWQEIRWMHSALIVDREDYELAETFFNSVTRRIFATVGVNERVEYVLSDTNPEDDDESASRAWRTYPRGRSTAELVCRVLTSTGWS
ncbi:MAG: isocitrate dehydrogenase kinase/phosphatase AceK regulatory subunit, partial [Steroidobacteraceae bacterium]